MTQKDHVKTGKTYFPVLTWSFFFLSAIMHSKILWRNKPMKKFLKTLTKLSITLCLVCTLLTSLNPGLPGNTGIVTFGDNFYLIDTDV